MGGLEEQGVEGEGSWVGEFGKARIREEEEGPGSREE